MISVKGILVDDGSCSAVASEPQILLSIADDERDRAEITKLLVQYAGGFHL